MNSSRFQKLSLSIFSFCVATTFCFVSANPCHAQLLEQLRFADRDAPIQYAPNDPLTRGRFFNLQTGHAGAFYNCGGEEMARRHSPFIRWQSSPESFRHRTFSDVLQWSRDRAEIAQRICDGASGCCAGDGDCKSCQKSMPGEVSVPGGCQGCITVGEASTAERLGNLDASPKVELSAVADGELAGLLSTEELQPKAESVTSASLLDRVHSARRTR